MTTPTHQQATPARKTAPPRGEAVVAERLWGTAELLAYFNCGTTKLAAIKADKGFPAPAVIGGLKRYIPAQVQAYVISKLPQGGQEGGAA
ncbi:hypothetical protein [Hydrogenophaga electricum]|uniref:DNA-binding protein n=1 Tax=Hydrogenophaga electricum TaxID=1230953 RepID=A0ABQ6C0W8_9BURK|nr:hypothetical protein [Hydrogenophaga electricum]GLS13627.1 hypothetical protein GCM10007935_10570 [Hydrogenophaga electricum]